VSPPLGGLARRLKYLSNTRERVASGRDRVLSRYCAGPYFFADDVGSAGLLVVGEEVSAGFLDSVADDPSDFGLPPLDDFRA
jgi:hypothetical protein